jgi:hypothetical protein
MNAPARRPLIADPPPETKTAAVPSAQTAIMKMFYPEPGHLGKAYFPKS